MSLLYDALNDPNVSVETIQAILLEQPKSIQYWHKGGVEDNFTVFRKAFATGVSMPVIQYLLEQKGRDNGVTLLHLAIDVGAPLPVIQFFTQKWPESLQTQTYNWGLPLHMACGNICNNPPIEIIAFLIESWPDALQQPNIRGSLPLHGACCGRGTVEIVALLLRYWPDALKVADKYDRLPLHLAIQCHAPFEVLELLVKEWPDALRIPGWHGWLAVHTMLSSDHVSLSKIQFLVEAWPESLQVQSSKDLLLPLHVACLSEAITDDIIRYLIDMYPDSIKVPDNEMHLPLHSACAWRSTGECEILETLVEAWPEALQARTIDGRLPLHMACKNELISDYMMIHYLIEAYPAALQVRDNKMQLPLHWACRCRASNLEIIDCLVRAWPESVHVSAVYNDDDGEEQNNNEMEEDKHDMKEGILVLPLDLRVKLFSDLADSGENRLEYLNAEFVFILTNGIPPLHFACVHPCTSWYPFRMKTLETLTYLIPSLEGEWMRFHHGMLAFHCACRAKAPESILQWCAEQNPQALVTTTVDMADTPLHCYLGSSNQTMLPTAISTGTTTSLSYQMSQNMSLSAVQFLIEKHRVALQSPNRQGFLPLHTAAMCNVPLDILFYLASEYPEVLLGGR